MPLHYWWEAFHTAVYLINKLPTPTLKMRSPSQVLTSEQTDYKSLRVFGCAYFPCLRPYQSHKFNFHSTKCVFLGFNNSHKGYKCLSPTGKIYLSRHVVFNESEFPFYSSFLNKSNNSQKSEIIIQYLPYQTSLNSDQICSNDTSHSGGTLPAAVQNSDQPLLPENQIPKVMKVQILAMNMLTVKTQRM